MARSGASLVTLSLLIAGCAGNEAGLCDVPDPLGSLVRVSETAIQSGQHWEAEVIWSVGGLDDEVAMTLPTSARVNAEGVVAIADFMSGDVWLLGADGRWLDPIAGRGEGPGELMNPLATAWTPEGDLLALDASQAKVERYGVATGVSETLQIPPDLLGPIVMSGAVGWFGLRGDGVAFVELPVEGAGGESRVVTFARAAPGDAAREVAWESEYAEGQVPGYDRLSLPEWPRTLLATGVDRWAVAPRSDAYEVIVFNASDEPQVHICVADDEVHGRSRPEVDERRDPGLIEQYEALPTSTTTALFSRVRVDHDGRIWIERTLPSTGSLTDPTYGVAGARMDVLTSEGEFLARMTLPEGLRFQDARGDTIWGFSIGSLDEIEVVAAEIQPVAR